MQTISENNSATKSGLSHQDYSEIATYAMRFDNFLERFENVTTNKLPGPFAQYLFVASGRINSEHPLGRILFQLTERVLKKIIQLNIPKESIGRLEDSYNNAVNFARFPDPYSLKSVYIDDISTHFRRLITDLNQVTNVYKPEEIEDLEITNRDFLPGSFLPTEDGKKVTPLSFDYDNFPWDQLKRDGWIELSDFGKVINEGSSWPPVTPEV